MSRLDTPALDTLSPEQREVHEQITSGPRGGVYGPLGVWLWRPELASRAQALGRYCRYDSSLPPRLSELAILTTARHWSAENRAVSDATYSNAVKLLGQDSVVDLVGVLGYYSLISMTINAFQVDAPGSNELA